MALTGSGFFVTQDSNGQVSYTRNGVFNLDSYGNIISNTGSYLQGYVVDDNNNLLEGSMGNIQIDTAPLAAKATDELLFGANLDAREEAIDTATYPFDPTDVNSYTSLRGK